MQRWAGTLRVVDGGSAGGLALLLAPICAAATVALEPVKDNTLFNTEPPTSNGAGNSIFSGRTGVMSGFIEQRGVVAFDLSGSIPPGSIINSATLTLTLSQFSPAGAPEVHTLHRILADWGEGTSNSFGGSGAPATAGDATWLHTFYNTQFWTAPGGDFEAGASAAQTINLALGPYTWGSTPQMVSDVQGWLDNPASSFGWLLLGNEVDANTSKKFASGEAFDPGLRPMLVIDFTPPCPWDCHDGDGIVGILDLFEMFGQWGASGTSCDFGDGRPGVDIGDLFTLFSKWGPCR